MKKIIINSFLLLIFILIVLAVILSTIGIETNKLNDLIINKVNNTKKNINLSLNSIKFKLDPKELSLFIETQNPKINYNDVLIPAKNVKVYIDFLSLLKSDPKIKKTNLILEELDISQLNKLSIIIKPSNFKSLLNNKIKEGKLISEIQIFLNEQGLLENFIAKGKVKDLKIELLNNLSLSKTNLSFFADKKDILIKNIEGNLENIKISDGDIKLNLDEGIKLNSNFNSEINLNKKSFVKYNKFLNKFKFINNVDNIYGNLNNNFFIFFDKTYKVKDFNYGVSGKINNSKLKLTNPIKNSFLNEQIDEIFLKDISIKSDFTPKKTILDAIGKYSIDNSEFLKLELKNQTENDLFDMELEFDFKNTFALDLINYKKNKDSIANISLDLKKKNENIEIKNLNYFENDNSIKVSNLKIKQNNLISFKRISIKTSNNDFSIQQDKKIYIKGTKFDASNLVKFFSGSKNENRFKNINSEIDIDFKNIKIPLSEKLYDFKLIGLIEKGKFLKISSKGDFGGNNFLDISLKKNKNNNKKYLEIYSDLTRPLLTEYSFFKGLSGGKLLFASIIDDSKSNSKLKIENFKVINAPGVIKLLSLADLGGLADLAEGDGLSFDVLEIDMEKNKNFLKINEILALGPSMSVLMEGYQEESGLTSLRGTLVPAKTLNKIISKIPVIGSIVIPKEIGEGLFGISFKMKGTKGKIKTTINPIRTLTPRFIQKIIDRDKNKKIN